MNEQEPVLPKEIKTAKELTDKEILDKINEALLPIQERYPETDAAPFIPNSLSPSMFSKEP